MIHARTHTVGAASAYWIETTVYELRHALRRVFRRRAFAICAVLSLGIAVGGTVAVFGLEDAIDFRALPYLDSDRLVSIQLYRPLNSICAGCRTPSPVALTERVAKSSSFQAVSAYRASGLALRDEVGAEYIRATEVGAEYFKLLGGKPMLGRVLQPADAWSDADPVLVAGYEFWARSLHADLSMIGRRVALTSDQDGLSRNFRVIGVMPRGFDIPANTGVWIPIRHEPKSSWILARLAPGVTRERAEAEVRNLLMFAAHEDATLQGASVRVLSLRQDQRAWSGVTNRRFLLVGIALLALLVSCSNLVTLYLSRLAGMRGELATRAALGSSAFRLVAHILCEVLVLGFVGSACGLWVAYWIMQLLTNRFGFAGVPLRIDARIVLVDLGMALGVSLVIAAAGVLSIRRSSIADGLRSTMSAGFYQGRGIQSVALVIQIAGAVVFTSAALQGLRQMIQLDRVELGFDPAGLLRVVFSSENQLGPTPTRAAVDSIHQRAAMDIRGFSTTSGVLVVAADARPLQDKVEYTYSERTNSPETGGELTQVAVTDAYFRTVGIPILIGRAFTTADRRDAAAVGILNQSASDRLWPGVSPIGKTLLIAYSATERRELLIVGLVPDVRFAKSGPTAPTPLLYRPFEQLPSSSREYWIRSSGDPQLVLAGLFRTVAGLRPYLSKARFPEIQILSEQLSHELAGPRLNTLALAGLALCTVVLAAIGTLGIVAYTVRMRTREIGIRLALGAPAVAVWRVVAGSTAAIGVVGASLGMIFSFTLASLLRASFVGLAAPDKTWILISGIASTTVILVAAYWPLSRVLKVSPAESLRAM